MSLCLLLAFKSFRGNIRGIKKMNFYLPDPVIVRLQELANQTGLSVAELVRRAIDEYLKKQK